MVLRNGTYGDRLIMGIFHNAHYAGRPPATGGAHDRGWGAGRKQGNLL